MESTVLFFFIIKFLFYENPLHRPSLTPYIFSLSLSLSTQEFWKLLSSSNNPNPQTQPKSLSLFPSHKPWLYCQKSKKIKPPQTHRHHPRLWSQRTRRRRQRTRMWRRRLLRMRRRQRENEVHICVCVCVALSTYILSVALLFISCLYVGEALGFVPLLFLEGFLI